MTKKIQSLLPTQSPFSKGSVFGKLKTFLAGISPRSIFPALKNFALHASWPHRLLALLAIFAFGFLIQFIAGKFQKEKITYETALAEKGTLITSISGSGTITSGNYTNITTKASGTIKKVYVTNGDTVKKGAKIAEIILDDYAKERQTAAWVTYLEAIEAVKEAVNAKAVADIDMWEAREAVLVAEEAYDDMLDNDTNPATNEAYTVGERQMIIKTVDQTKKAFTVAETKYLNADADIAASNAKVAAALRNYQENSATILASADGEVSDLALAEGTLLSASSATSSTSGATIVSAQTVGKVNNPSGQLVATVSLTEIDIINVKAGQKVTLVLDAYEDLSFTGKVLAVNTSGSVSSGVTSYPVTILLDPVSVAIYPNMAVTVEIITSMKTDIVLVPTTAIQTFNDQEMVQILKDGQPNFVQVETGEANDSQTEIVSGLNEGDVVVTSTISSATEDESGSTSSLFSGVSGSRLRSSGGAIMGSMGGGPPGGF